MKSVRGQFLLASPKLLDDNFVHAVVLMIQHDDEGAMGLIINRPTEVEIRAEWEQLDHGPCNAEDVLYQGGPCNGPLMVVHTQSHISDKRVVPGLFLSVDDDEVMRLVELGQTPARYIVGYAGWGPGQLEDELKTDAWLIAPATADLVFGPTDGLWSKLVRHARVAAGLPDIKPTLIPIDPTMN